MKKIIFAVTALFIGGVALACDKTDGGYAGVDATLETLVTDRNRREGRRDDRGDDRDGRQDCRQEEGRVGDDKRDCKQDEREEDRGEDQPDTEQNA